ncbi:hypothetical protein SDC9_107258 [bioreactor metagenome]|uniref:Uncharacterized protein n=1 Tax=bioreactor metagenome TaxID=1076179 RepID=A0A645B4U4_9ZZZZ
MPNHVSQQLNLHAVSHKDLDFVDIVLSPDTKLFLDPCLIEFGGTEWTAQAQRTITSYFDCFYRLYRDSTSDEEKLALFEHAHEINATRLGYGNGHNGKAKTPLGMLNTFRIVPSLLFSGIELSKASDLAIFIKRFAEDCMSDMLTNIIFRELMQFTLFQCEKYDIKTQNSPSGYFYWNADIAQWNEYQGPSLLINGKLILLVPKGIVRNRYYFNADQFFSRVILTRVQQEQSWLDGKGIEHKPSKKELRKKIQSGKSVLECAISMTSEFPKYLPEYHHQLPALYSRQGMSDEELDTILY